MLWSIGTFACPKGRTSKASITLARLGLIWLRTLWCMVLGLFRSLMLWKVAYAKLGALAALCEFTCCFDPADVAVDSRHWSIAL